MDQLEEVISRIDIVQLISSYLPLKQAGRNFKGLCPFHSEKTPSMIVSPELQIFKCFGCSKGGNAIKFVSEYEKITFGEALRQMAQKVGIKLSSYLPDKEQQLKDRLYQINHLASEFFHYLLVNHKAGQTARAYLLGRGINKESVEVFKLGFAPESWRNLFNYLVGKKGYKTEEVEAAGLIIGQAKTCLTARQGYQLKAKNYYDRFRGRIIFPIFDHRGQIVGFSGRVLNQGDQVDQAKYVNSPETVVYHKSKTLYGLWQTREAIKREDGVILTEGEFDTISSYQAGVKNIVAIKGSAVTQEQIELLSRFTRNFYFCLDTDTAGQMAAYRGIELAENTGVNIKVISLPQGKDPDECVRTDPGAWHKAVKKAITVWDFYLQSAISRFGRSTGEAKKRVSEEILPLFNKITNEVVKAHYLKKLADQLEVDQEAVITQARRLESREKVYADSDKADLGKKEAKQDREEILEEYLLALILHAEDDFGKMIETWKPDCLKTGPVKRIFSYLEKWRQKSPILTIEKFVKILPSELEETSQRLFLLPLQGLEEDKENLIKEWQKTLSVLENLSLRVKLGELKKNLSDKTKSPEEEETVEKELLAIIKKLK